MTLYFEKAWGPKCKLKNFGVDIWILAIGRAKVQFCVNSFDGGPNLSYASTTKFGIILCHNSPYGELWLAIVCPHMTYWHTFTNYNSSYDELWHKIVPN